MKWQEESCFDCWAIIVVQQNDGAPTMLRLTTTPSLLRETSLFFSLTEEERHFFTDQPHRQLLVPSMNSGLKPVTVMTACVAFSLNTMNPVIPEL